METTLGGGFALVPHPGHPPRAVAGVTCSLVWQSAGAWVIDFIVGAAPELLKLPAAAVPERADDLWRHTCFELFLREPEGEAYREFNFSPSGQWAAYAFDGYRTGRRSLEVNPPSIVSNDPAQFFTGMDARLQSLGLDEESIGALLAATPPPPAAMQYGLQTALEDPAMADGRDWRAGLSAIIEEADGTKSYWALAHPPGKPDFHHPDCFALELPAPDGA